MLPNLPLPLPDETLYSWCHAVQRSSGLGCTLTSSNLFGKPRAGFRHDFPAYLDTLTERTAGGLGTAAEIIDRRTLLGFFLRTAEKSEVDAIVHSVRSDVRPHLKLEFGLPASKISAFHPLKSCAECRKSDQSDYGRSYWHWEHQLPSVLICPRHHLLLDVCSNTRSPTALHYWLEPSKSDCRIVCARTSEAMPFLTRVADDTIRLMNLPMGSLRRDVCVAALRSTLKSNGLLSLGGHVRQRSAFNLVAARLKPIESISAPLLWPRLDQAMVESMVNLGRWCSIGVHPLKFLLLVECLTDRWEDFSRLLQGPMCSTSDLSIGPEPAAPLQVEASLPPTPSVKELLEKGMSLTAAAIHLGVSTTTVTQWARQQCVAFNTRPKWLGASTRRVIEDRLGRGDTVHDIGALTGASRASISRILAANKETKLARKVAIFSKKRSDCRRDFVDSLRKSPSAPVREFRSKPNSPYTWLYRNDRNWLTKIIASRSNITTYSQRKH
ncbi:hypothetical protein C1922_14775 [Stenotrophomonas sp. ZAC14D2_NAIMI4_7]|nr:hypothetical protein C1922_14775 [Stenotrophomonas sp. ZAC14D2_NAIMI4_7]